MARFIQYLLLFTTTCFLLNCEKKIVDNIYYGIYAFEDLQFSNPLIIDFETKKVLSAMPEFSTDVYRLTDSTLLKGDLIFDIKYENGYLKTERDSLVVHVFKKVVSKPPKINGKHEMLETLKSRVWRGISSSVDEEESLERFSYYKFNDSIVGRLTLYLLDKEVVHSEKEEYRYTIVDFKSRFFLYLKPPNTKSKFSTFLELKAFTDENLVFSGVKGNQDLKLTIANGDADMFFTQQQNKFAVCNEDLIGQYYYNGLGSNYDGGLRKIQELLENNYDLTNNDKDSGYIRIRFVVNCNGQTGRFSVLQVDKDYQPSIFTNSLVKQLFEFTMSLSDWKLGILTETGDPYDNYRHLTFKIENGKVLEIFP